MAKNDTNIESGEGEVIPFYKSTEFITYRTWRSLPAILRGMDTEALAKSGFEDPDIIDLLSIRTQGQFAERFKMNPNTLSVWNKYLDENGDRFKEANVWASKLVKEVIAATYRAATLRDPKANADRKLFLQLAGWVEKTEQKHEVEVKGLFDVIKQYADKQRNAKDGGSGTEPTPDQE